MRSPAKKLAARLRELKKKGSTDEMARYLYELMTDRNVSALDILIQLHYLGRLCKSVKERLMVVRLMIEWHKMHHGTRIQTENTHQVTDWKIIISNPEIHENK